MANPPSITDLTNQLKALAAEGPGKDFKVTEAGYNQYISALKGYRSQLTTHYHTATKSLTDLGSVGTFPSAEAAKSELQGNVTPDALTALNNQIEYLEQLENTVHTLYSQFHAQDTA